MLELECTDCGFKGEMEYTSPPAPPKKDRVRLEIEYGKDKQRKFLELITLTEGGRHASFFHEDQYIKITIKEVVRDVE